MSQSTYLSQSSPMVTLLTLPVAKYSFATGSNAQGAIPWGHLMRDDIDVLFDVSQPSNLESTKRSKINMRIVQVISTLEFVPIEELCQEATALRVKMQSMGITPTMDQLTIFAITKHPLLAIRYRLSNGEARRIQMKFRSEGDCDAAVQVVKSLGIEFQEQASNRPKTSASRPGPSRSPSSLSALTNRPVTAAAPERPDNADTASTLPFALSTSHYFPQKLPDAAHVSAEASRSATSNLDILPPCAVVNGQTTLYRLNTSRDKSSSQVQSQSYLSEPTTTDAVAPQRPSSSHLYRSSAMTHHHQQQDVFPSLHPAVFTPSAAERPSSSFSSSLLPTVLKGDGQFLPADGRPDTAASMPPPSFKPPLSTADEQRSSSLGDFSSDPAWQPSSDTELPPSQRPWTAPASQIPETLTHLIPPRRELPFKRPGSSSRPSSSAALPPLRKPTLVSEASTVPSREAARKRVFGEDEQHSMLAGPEKTIPSPRRKAAALREARAEASRKSTNSGASDTAIQQATPENQVVHVPQIAVSALPTEVPLLKKPRVVGPRKMDGTVSSSETTASVCQTSQADFKEQILAAPIQTPVPSRATSANKPPRVSSLLDADHEVVDRLGAFLYKPPAPSPKALQPVQEENLAEYAAQCDEDRIAAIDTMICEYLYDDNFKQLCGDVESCWRRIGLGL
ncbi:hypothetical protein LTR66_009611 [Elasticomyces elasticus]|nr:hypothetical protein LTR28_003092 [Elasticomyces elasticus]KAK4981914.1 hypothetical protein LTR66_009611 [Elasticomyces elasticus]